MKKSIAKMTAFGSEWFKAGAKRAYFNNLEELYGLSIVESDAGRIVSATLDGEPIEVKQAILLRCKFSVGSVWFDFEKATFHYENLDKVLATHIIEEIRKQVNEAAYHG